MEAEAVGTIPATRARPIGRAAGEYRSVHQPSVHVGIISATISDARSMVADVPSSCVLVMANMTARVRWTPLHHSQNRRSQQPS